MSKVTSKLQLTLPKAIADRYGIRPGDEVEWTVTEESIRLEPVRGTPRAGQQLTLEERVELFDQGTKRLGKLQAEQLNKAAKSKTRGKDRGWTREELYVRGLAR
jgi:AbrB family looped-hinge helix DNA binding protein